jgi:hypothetical protein
MESWNDGIMGFQRIFTIYPISQYPKTHFSNIPAFHHSNWGETLDLIKTIK